MPIFGDCFSDAAMKLDESLKKVETDEQGHQYITQQANQYCEFVDLSESDAIYGSTFAMMIKQAFRQDKHFIVAKVSSRGVDQFENDSESSMSFDVES